MDRAKVTPDDGNAHPESPLPTAVSAEGNGVL